MKNGLLIGVRTEDLRILAPSIQSEQIQLYVAINFGEMERICAQEMIDLVFLACEHKSEQRLRILAHIFTASPASEIHIMGCMSDPVEFITGILKSAGVE